MKSPEVSIIMPVFNGERYLSAAIGSILHQTFRDFEFIIIDDGSTDRTIEIVKSFADQRIILLRNSCNSGIVKSLNAGIDLAKGKFIARMDADDYSIKYRLAHQVKILSAGKSSAYGTSIIVRKPTHIRYKQFSSDYEAIKFRMLYSNNIAHPSVMVRADILKSYRYLESDHFVEDYSLWCRMLADGHQITNTVLPLLIYRIHQDQISASRRLEQYSNAARVARVWAEHYLDPVQIDLFSPFDVFYKEKVSLDEFVEVIVGAKKILAAKSLSPRHEIRRVAMHLINRVELPLSKKVIILSKHV